jgi:hypothetical protein
MGAWRFIACGMPLERITSCGIGLECDVRDAARLERRCQAVAVQMQLTGRIAHRTHVHAVSLLDSHDALLRAHLSAHDAEMKRLFGWRCNGDGSGQRSSDQHRFFQHVDRALHVQPPFDRMCQNRHRVYKRPSAVERLLVTRDRRTCSWHRTGAPLQGGVSCKTREQYRGQHVVSSPRWR